MAIVKTRDYWMIYRGPSFLAIVWFGSSLIPSHPLSHLSFSVFLCVPGRPYWRVSGMRWERSQIKEKLFFYKLFSTFWWKPRDFVENFQCFVLNLVNRPIKVNEVIVHNLWVSMQDYHRKISSKNKAKNHAHLWLNKRNTKQAKNLTCM
jgi:hypothetical protein